MEQEFAYRVMSLKPPDETKGQFLQRLGISRQTMNSWEHGEHGATLSTVAKLAKVLNVDPRWLGFGSPELEGEPYSTGVFRLYRDMREE